MRYLIAAVLLTTSAACASAPTKPTMAARQGPLALGASWVKADLKMKNVDDASVALTDVKGDKGTLVVFTCNHCPWAKAWEGRITALGNAYRAKGVGVVAVNPNDPTAYEEDAFVEMQERAQAAGMTFPYVVDQGGALAQAFGATKTPEVFLFDAGDKLVYYGAVDDNANDEAAVENQYLKDALQSLVDGAPIAVASTKALGCSIKL